MYRINGFKQINAFYSWVFENQDKVRPHHVSLYVFLWNQDNRANWVEYFKCPFDLAITGACIGNRNTYYKTLNDLKQWGLIEYQKGINEYKAPIIKLVQLYKNDTATDTSTDTSTDTPTITPIDTSTDTASVHIYNYITINIKLITSKWEEIKNFIEGLKNGNNTPTLEDILQYAKDNLFEIEDAKDFYLHYTSYDWTDANGRKVKNWRTRLEKWCRDNSLKRTAQQRPNKGGDKFGKDWEAEMIEKMKLQDAKKQLQTI